MSANNTILPALEAALVDFLVAAPLPWAQAILGQSAQAVADEEQAGILGQFVPVPCVLVATESAPMVSPEHPCVAAPVTVTVRHSVESSSVAQHRADANAAFDRLWDVSALEGFLAARPDLLLSGFTYDGAEFRREERALETVLSLTFTIASKTTP